MYDGVADLNDGSTACMASTLCTLPPSRRVRYGYPWRRGNLGVVA
jgi:hypothetical protein